jgi:hypothetical protein
MEPPVVRITTLGGPHLDLPGRLVDEAGRRAGVITAQPLPPGVSVKVEGESILLLGDVWHSEPRGAEFYSTIHIEHLIADSRIARMVTMVRGAAAAT